MSDTTAAVDSELVLRDQLIAELRAQIDHLLVERECWMTATSAALRIATAAVAERGFPSNSGSDVGDDRAARPVQDARTAA